MRSIKIDLQIISIAKSIGIDVGITKFCHDSDDNAVENPLYLNKNIKRLRRASRRLSRKQKDSKNRQKARIRLQILHEKIRNQRRDFTHKLSVYYSKRYDIVFLEKLRTLNMVKNHHLARHIVDSSWATFKRFLQYKVKMVIGVSSANTSVDCSRCANRVPKSLAVRVHKCDKCGLAIDRDYNASLNIKERLATAKATAGTAGSHACRDSI